MQNPIIHIFLHLTNTSSRVRGRDFYAVNDDLRLSTSLHGQTSTRKSSIKLNLALAGTLPGLSFAREFLKLAVRAAVNYASTKKWLTYWNSSPIHADIARAAPFLLKKIFRPYMTSRLRCDERLGVLTSHYDFIVQQKLSSLILRAATEPVVLSEFSGKSAHVYQIQLVVGCDMEREGEMVLQLVSEGSILFSVAFTFYTDAGVRTVAIGCLQGGRKANSLDHIRYATRDMFGLRPKTLMVKLVQQIGRAFACRDLLLVGNQNRAVTTQINQGKVFANYNATWLELDARARPDGDFTLACGALLAPNLEAIASNKRSEAKKRYALLTDISRLTCEELMRAKDNVPIG